MKRTLILLFAATLVMAALNWSGATAIPWLVVFIPVLVPVVEWVALSVLAVGLIIVAAIMDANDRRGRK